MTFNLAKLTFSTTIDAITNDQLMNQMISWTLKLRNSQKLNGVAPLKSTPAKTVFPKRDHLSSVDGPFTEGKEVVVGYYVVEASSFAEAETLARECPKFAAGSAIEIREVGEFPDS